jgi:hypothetical protein
MGLQPDLSVYPDAAARHVSTKTWGVATTASAPPATLRFEEARKDAHAAYFERTLPGRSAQQPAWVEEDRKEANRPFGDAWDSRALPTPEFQQPGPPIELEADGVTVRAAGTQPSLTPLRSCYER